jgi:hypothetical protein
VVIGAGLVGLEAVYALYRRGLEVTVVEKAPQIAPQQFDDTASRILKRDMEAEGIRLILGTGIERILGPSLWERIFRREGKGVLLEDGSRLRCELVIVATGASPNVDVVKNTGIRINRGIVVNDLMQASIPDIYAAGDVAETSINGRVLFRDSCRYFWLKNRSRHLTPVRYPCLVGYATLIYLMPSIVDSHKPVDEAQAQLRRLFRISKSTYWYLETVNLYFGKKYRSIYEDVMEELSGKKLVIRDDERLIVTLKA